MRHSSASSGDAATGGWTRENDRCYYRKWC